MDLIKLAKELIGMVDAPQPELFVVVEKRTWTQYGGIFYQLYYVGSLFECENQQIKLEKKFTRLVGRKPKTISVMVWPRETFLSTIYGHNTYG